MALRHTLQCGWRELADALSALRDLHREGAGFSLLSYDSRRAFLAVRALEYEDMIAPSDVDPVTLVEAIAAAGVFAESLREDFERIRKEIENA
ncbi:hypothetical protein [Mesorhizobium sp. B2-4-17]|uniref:hypothetical protein n=1 Tax=Mesorhizobium sp. B2-4-17 TaxID=2589932 RepID=UPI00112E7E3A|nr:hypothetical protein [Mesorhizobium sp. B2-4-17]TPK78206.1 hypothetical protein FJ548_25060 [Mesorhizobium sp. B2-4-17]